MSQRVTMRDRFRKLGTTAKGLLAKRPSAIQQNFIFGLGLVSVFGAFIFSGALLQKNKDSLDDMIKDKRLADKGQGSFNDEIAGITYYSAIGVALYGLALLLTKNAELNVYIPYVISVVTFVLFLTIGYVGATLIQNQLDLNSVDKDNPAVTNNVVGSLYVCISIIGLGFTIWKAVQRG
jgi:hypothetical protein